MKEVKYAGLDNTVKGFKFLSRAVKFKVRLQGAFGSSSPRFQG